MGFKGDLNCVRSVLTFVSRCSNFRQTFTLFFEHQGCSFPFHLSLFLCAAPSPSSWNSSRKNGHRSLKNSDLGPFSFFFPTMPLSTELLF